MAKFLESFVSSAGYSIRDVAQERASCPMLICHRICYGYMNNNWVMVFSNAAILVLTIGYFIISMTSSKPISG